MNPRWKISAAFSAAALLVSLGYPLVMLPGMRPDGWAMALHSGEAFLRFAALPTLIAGAIAYFLAPALIQTRGQLLQLTLRTGLTILVTYFVYCVTLGILSYITSTLPANFDLILGSFVFALFGLVFVAPAFLLMTILLPVFLRFLIFKDSPAR